MKQEKVPLFAQHHKNKKPPIVDTNPSDDNDVASIDGSNQQSPPSESLPAWVVISWKRQFLPLLYTTLVKARQPFLHYSKGTQELVVTIQGLVNQVYPMAKYKVAPDDLVFEKVM